MPGAQGDYFRVRQPSVIVRAAEQSANTSRRPTRYSLEGRFGGSERDRPFIRCADQPGVSSRGDDGCKGLADVIPLTVGSGSRRSFPSRSPFSVFLETLSNAERRDLADQR